MQRDKSKKYNETAQLFLGRAKTLLQRELLRDALGKCIQELSRGGIEKSFKKGVRYIIKDASGSSGVYIHDGDDIQRGWTFKFMDLMMDLMMDLARYHLMGCH